MARSSGLVSLISVDDDVLDMLVQAATNDAEADDVTPPPGAPGGAWTPPRVAWLRSFHRDRRSGLDGEAGEATWAVVVDDRVVGSVRLKRGADERVLETGAWLTRAARGRGVGRAAAAAVVREAAAVGARAVRAETTTGNAAALAVLDRLGFELRSDGDGREVRALLSLEPDSSAAAHQ